MTLTNRRFALAYLLLVIVPIVGLAGVLRSGRELTAPTAIGGDWRMYAQIESLAASPCGRSLMALRDVEFTVAQSGKDFTLNFAGGDISAASGTIRGTKIKANLLISTQQAEAAGCGRVLSLTASLNSKASPKLILGELFVSDCSACAPVEFRAVREKQTDGE